MSLSPCQEIFSHTPQNFSRPSAPLTSPFFHVCQVFFRISSSNFLSSFCQEIFCQVQVFSFLIFKNVKKFLRSKLDRPRFRGFVKRFFHLSSSKSSSFVQNYSARFFTLVKYYFHKSSSNLSQILLAIAGVSAYNYLMRWREETKNHHRETSWRLTKKVLA